MIIPALVLTLTSLNTDLLPVQQNHQVVVQSFSVDKQNRQQRLSATEAIKLAKQAAKLLKSPPRIYQIGGGENVQAWLDKPGSVETYYNTCGAPPPEGMKVKCQAPMKLTVVVKPGRWRGAYNVTFASTWGKGGNGFQHSWQFDVSANRKVTFGHESGDTLPYMPD